MHLSWSPKPCLRLLKRGETIRSNLLANGRTHLTQPGDGGGPKAVNIYKRDYRYELDACCFCVAFGIPIGTSRKARNSSTRTFYRGCVAAPPAQNHPNEVCGPLPRRTDRKSVV